MNMPLDPLRVVMPILYYWRKEKQYKETMEERNSFNLFIQRIFIGHLLCAKEFLFLELGVYW